MIYFQGCTAREKLKKISISTQKLLYQAGVEYRLLETEGCCGSILLRTGFSEDAQDVMRKTWEKLKDEQVLVSCAGCYRTFKKDYPNILGAKVNVIHTSQLFAEMIQNGKISLLPYSREEKVTYHDPCHLGRHMKEYQAPRDVLKKTAILVEMSRNRELARCCGAGSGVKSACPKISHEVAKMRLEDARKTGSELLVTCCPFCILNLKSADESSENENYGESEDSRERLEILDLSQFLLKKLREDAP
ncbi:MAG: (Fe-S)-binding protein [Methanobacteriaceae archaeon]